jgi:predicted transcriptional regulator of viral defense system
VHPRLQHHADRRLGAFTSQEALAAGYSVDEVRVALRTRRWVRLRKGVYMEAARWAAAGERERHLALAAAVLECLAAGPVLSHASAARMHGFLVPDAAGQDVRVTAVDQWRTGRGYRVARAALPHEDVVPWLGDVAVTSPARTLIDCSREWTLTAAVVALDAALHAGAVTRPQLLAAVRSARHRTGASAAARAVGLSDGRAESPWETEGRLAMLAAGLPLPELQVEIWDQHGFVGRADGFYEEAAVAIEFDGRIKYSDPWNGRSPGEVLWEEKRREDRMRRAGLRVVRLARPDLGPTWRATVSDVGGLLAEPYTGPRRFRAVRRAEPGAGTDAA